MKVVRDKRLVISFKIVSYKVINDRLAMALFLHWLSQADASTNGNVVKKAITLNGT